MKEQTTETTIKQGNICGMFIELTSVAKSFF